MKFVQIIDFETERLEEMQQLVAEAGRRTAGRSGGPTRSILLRTGTGPTVTCADRVRLVSGGHAQQ
ncbi:hypothetical protein [Streptomyces sp. NPDC003456]|uniref:hypothetical protein n=1 Tax=Streptomyces sp. NPDC003456 TaxID=3364683 RepID=UPI0036CAA378